ncbi:MAG: ferritin-like domain-containing protein, partial [Myxococcota bacterium]
MPLRADVAIRYAASLVLAGCPSTTASRSGSPAGRGQAEVPPSPSPLVSASTPAETSPRDDEADGADTGIVGAPLDAAATDDAPSVPNTPYMRCSVYVAQTTNTAADPRSKRDGIVPSVQSTRLNADGSTQCTIQWSRRSVSESMLVTPTCCRRGSGPAPPCPAPRMEKVSGFERDLQTVTLVATATPQDPRIDEAQRGEVTTVRDVPPPRRHTCGRRPEGFTFAGPADAGEEAGGDRREIGAELAAMAALEAASVPAFERLARELEAHGAPGALVQRALEARDDERRHARTMAGLARDFGTRVRSWSKATSLPVRSRRAMGRENAAEGCVHEAYGAATALFQSHRAQDDAIRAAFAVIADEELRHAALAWDVHAWLLATADAAEREALTTTMTEALAHFEAAPFSVAARETLGLPDVETAHLLFAAMA